MPIMFDYSFDRLVKQVDDLQEVSKDNLQKYESHLELLKDEVEKWKSHRDWSDDILRAYNELLNANHL